MTEAAGGSIGDASEDDVSEDDGSEDDVSEDDVSEDDVSEGGGSVVREAKRQIFWGTSPSHVCSSPRFAVTVHWTAAPSVWRSAVVSLEHCASVLQLFEQVPHRQEYLPQSESSSHVLSQCVSLPVFPPVVLEPQPSAKLHSQSPAGSVVRPNR